MGRHESLDSACFWRGRVTRSRLSWRSLERSFLAHPIFSRIPFYAEYLNCIAPSFHLEENLWSFRTAKCTSPGRHKRKEQPTSMLLLSNIVRSITLEEILRTFRSTRFLSRRGRSNQKRLARKVETPQNENQAPRRDTRSNCKPKDFVDSRRNRPRQSLELPRLVAKTKARKQKRMP
jgi:hypothetical protein